MKWFLPRNYSVDPGSDDIGESLHHGFERDVLNAGSRNVTLRLYPANRIKTYHMTADVMFTVKIKIQTALLRTLLFLLSGFGNASATRHISNPAPSACF